MEVKAAAAAWVAISIILVTVIITLGLRVADWVWVRPKKLEKFMRAQGFHGNPYRLLYGDLKELLAMVKHVRSTHITLSDDIPSYTLSYFNHLVNKFGKHSFVWFGPQPRMNIMEPELVKEILSKPDIFQKPHPEPMTDAVVGGLLVAEGDKWARHRKMINPAFHLAKLKDMFPAIRSSCSDLINKWEMLSSTTGSAEVDVFPYLDDLSNDVISRTAFGSNHEQGKRISQLQKERVDLVGQVLLTIYVPGWRHLPIAPAKRLKKVNHELEALLRGVITKRQKVMEMGEVGNNKDLLGILLESNSKEIKENGVGMSMEDVIEECKLFYFAGSETTSNLLTWTMILLGVHSNWQARAREEVLQVFGTNQPDFDGLNHLKIVTMIFHEALRLYPPVVMTYRAIYKETKLGNMTLPAGMQFTVPTLLVHHDREIWGEDAEEFKPERFSEGVFNATKGRFAFFPFGGGPRICIGQNLALIEAKTAMAMILQRFKFDLSPSYKHSPFPVFTLPPQFGAPIILHKI